MILKQAPEDFRVEELTDVVPGTHGPFAFYRLEKSGWTTPDALAALRRRWRIDVHRLSYGGLKDRHGQTSQYLTVFHGPRRKLTHERVRVEYLGQVSEPFTSQHIRANRFDLVLRNLEEREWQTSREVLADVARSGIPNYFDDQRFGSVRPGQPFFARVLIAGQFEEALKVALASAYEHDRAPQKTEKALLRQYWGDWARLKESLPRGHARSLVCYLVDHPVDFKGAVARLRPDLRSLYLSAYQSHLWNRILARWLQANLPPTCLTTVRLRLGEVPMPQDLNEQQQRALSELSLPLPSSRTHLLDQDPIKPIIDGVLAEDGLTLAEMRIKGVREAFFSRGERAALCLPRNMTWSADPDETRPGRLKMKLSFELPRGAYATLIVKRLMASSE